MFPQIRQIHRFVEDMHDAQRVWEELEGAEKGTDRLRLDEEVGCEAMSV